jgi:hypothetical protein
MNIEFVRALIESKKKYEVSLKSGSVMAKITFIRINRQGFIEALQSEKGSQDLYYFLELSNIEAVSSSEPFDIMF